VPPVNRRPRRVAVRAEAATPPVSLRMLADHLGLSPATISLVVNRAPGARAIPKATQDRVLAAARRFNYRPNSIARSLRAQRTFTVGVLVPEISEGYSALVMSGIEEHLLQAGYLYFVASHRHRADLIDEYPRLLLDRSIEGLIAIDTPCPRKLPVPVVAVSGHGTTPGVTNIVLDHAGAVRQALDHLVRLGHTRIAVIKGQAFSSDTSSRWEAIAAISRELGVPIDSGLTVQLEGDLPSPELGYGVTRQLLARRPDFTALFAFNDVSAIGAMRALREAGRRVPDDVSIVGFDDIQSAAFQQPGLTTVRQPLRRMGELAAEIVVRRIDEPRRSIHAKQVRVESELIVRGSTGPAGTLIDRGR
jgi:DNA-binding LacI/PurR family transcriptional regulator